MTASRDELVAEALEQIDALMSYRRRAFSAQQLHREISMPQLHILMALQERGPITVSELAHMLCSSAPSASSIVDRMEERQWVQRVRDVVDRRVVHVEISERGRSVVEELSGLKREQLQRLLRSMTGDELQDVIRGVAAVCRALDRVHDAADECPVDATSQRP